MSENAPRHAAWRIPGYVVEDLLGAGASGQVWRARVRSSGDEVALKRILLDGPQQVTDAQREAAVLAALDHPHLIRIHEFVALDDAAVLVLDLAAGGSLAALIEARGRLTPGEAITALAPIGAALAHAHNAGVVHGDVTPANVLFTDVGLPLLADLGVARLLGARAEVRSTPASIDPAVAAGCLPGPGSDVFMLAASAVHVLTGEPLWRGATVNEALAHAVTGDTGEVAQRLHHAGVPDAMALIVCRALAVEPQLRGTAADFALDLRHAGEPVAVELAAGRERRAASLPPAPPETGEPIPRPAATTANPAVVTTEHPGRPDFTRPHHVAPAGAAPLTHGVRIRPPVLPRRRPSWWRHRAVAGAAAALVVVVLAAGLTLWWPGPHSDAHGAQPLAPATASRLPSIGAPSATATMAPPKMAPPTIPAASPTTPSAAPPAQIDAAGVAAVLARLDARRAQAYATRKPALLAGVYVTGALLQRDAATLERIVPAGCGLQGARTAYRVERIVTRSSTRLTVLAHATLAGSTLICHSTTRGQAPGAGPTPLRISLVRHDGGYRIAEITAT